MSGFPFLWLYGPSGVGKTTVGWELFKLLKAADVHCAYVDADQLGLCYPAPDDDRDNHRIKAANLGAAWRGFRATDAKCLILSGYVLTAAEVRLYTDAVPDTSLTMCRLRASHSALEERYTKALTPTPITTALLDANPTTHTTRITHRTTGSGPPIPADTLRNLPTEAHHTVTAHALREAAALRTAGIGDIALDTSDLTAQESADALFQLLLGR